MKAVPLAAATAALAVVVAAGAPGSAAELAAAPTVTQGTSAVLDDRWGDDETGEDEYASAFTGSWRADKDDGSVFTIARVTGADDTYSKSDPSGRKITGKGVTVAVIDTGVAPVPGLNLAGKVINGPDLSFDGQTAGTRHLDGYGHGTHMAAIIAGRDTSVAAGAETDPRGFVGIAPDARILNMKVAAADGGADVTQVIAAIDWVVQHRNDNGMNVRVINLSYGTHSTQPYSVDPLARAVENAWSKGIAVVVAAGNDGIGTPSLTMPAADPYVIAVGAADHMGTPDLKDDRVADFSNGGSTARRVDLIAPGKSVVSLRVPGSYADKGHPEGLVAGDPAARLFRGSGTSQSAAVVSGAAALLYQARPRMTPDQLKRLLMSSARRLELHSRAEMGAGLLDIKRALELSTPSVQSARQAWPQSTGHGSLDGARGDDHAVDPQTGASLYGEVDAQGAPWDGRRWSSASAAGTAWSGGTWNGRRWSGDAWSGGSWQSAAWTGRSWSGVEWQGRRWSSDYWNGRRWSGDDWLGRRWSSEAWNGRRWSTTSNWDVSTTW